MRSYLLLAIALFPIWLNAQKHDYVWVYGYANNQDTNSVVGGAVIDFKQDPPLMYKQNRDLNFSLTCGVCSDSSGNLLFYSNGIRIFNHLNQLMENGDTINPGQVWENIEQQGYPNPMRTLSLPAPGQSNVYYFFYIGFYLLPGSGTFSPFYYSLVNMNDNGGAGKVLSKNQIVLEGDFAEPDAVKHANGRDWWIILPVDSIPVYHVFLLDQSGLHGPFTQTSGDPADFPQESDWTQFSPNGEFFVRNGSDGMCFYDFNRCTGELSNPRYWPRSIHGYSSGPMVFSPDSRFLYVNNSSFVVQFDLSAGEIGFASMDTVQRHDKFFDPSPIFPTGYYIPQLAPNNKIYYSCASSTPWMNIINRPGLPCPACDAENHGIHLPRFNYLMQCRFPNYRLGAWAGSPCDTLADQRPGFVKTTYEAFLERQAQGPNPAPPEPAKPLPTRNNGEDWSMQTITRRAIFEKSGAKTEPPAKQ